MDLSHLEVIIAERGKLVCCSFARSKSAVRQTYGVRRNDTGRSKCFSVAGKIRVKKPGQKWS
ncbi:MAG: hypothetical protein LWX52_11990 [Deltaproteobacteria bacterium]|nr:hypothetical protein [Deltaproteobacteria bacterium]